MVHERQNSRGEHWTALPPELFDYGHQLCASTTSLLGGMGPTVREMWCNDWYEANSFCNPDRLGPPGPKGLPSSLM